MQHVTQAMQAAYMAEGVKQWTCEDGVYTCPVQHSARKAKDIRDRANRHLAKHAQGLQMCVARVQSGEAMYMIYATRSETKQ